MIEELATASVLLQRALERYLAACSAVQKSCAFGDLPPELANRVVQELELVPTYESMLRYANSSIRYARNALPFTPINSLPYEVMSHIFGLVVGDNCSLYQVQSTGCKVRSKYPDILARVCSHWRHIALGLRTFWSHIDIFFDDSFNTPSISRADIHALRAGETPLFLHVHLSNTAQQSSFDSATLQSIAAIAPRTWAFDITSETPHRNLLETTFETVLRYCTPGMLTKLTVKSLPAFENTINQFILARLGIDSASHVDVNNQNLIVGLPAQYLDDAMLHLNSLNMERVFIPWYSRAYHNLSELRLTTGSGGLEREGGTILESDLIVILRSSPLLQSLELGLVVLGGVPTTTPVEPIVLHHIEMLKVVVQVPGRNPLSLRESELGTLLRWISPGPKLLRLSIINFPGVIWTVEAPLFKGELVRDFFRRSNVATVTAKWLNADHQIADLWNAAPTIKCMILEELERRSLVGRGFQVTDSSAYLETLYMLKSDITILWDVILALKPRRVFLWNCYGHFTAHSEPPNATPRMSQSLIIPSNVKSQLSHIPTIQFLERDPRILDECEFE
ncbi:hypothetical protein RSOLAG1IB_09891 [Rhizoctonia solani AG-1 IB]|uniref:F-box domain-containing protein n=1 Tax=Thanatephorus cucumeris (strain AG1-IB / isolate 7/3/14) TaxID=1108050 RepID=A0A0B7FWJ9_THACB|nr:hypothetical protein RSOLAG1IB_09891 [Rhizoctonia solani AG-1 IB]